MKLLTKEIAARLPKLYSQDGKSKEDVKVIVKFFDPTGSWTWYVTEGEQREDGDWEFFGLVSGFEAELGYFTLRDLERAKAGFTGLQALPIERDLHFGFNHTLAEVQQEINR
jgi:hypothetical protein